MEKAFFSVEILTDFNFYVRFLAAFFGIRQQAESPTVKCRSLRPPHSLRQSPTPIDGNALFPLQATPRPLERLSRKGDHINRLT